MQRPSFAHNLEAWSSKVTWHQAGQVISTRADPVRIAMSSGVRDDSLTVLVPPVHLCRGLGPVFEHRPGPLPISSTASSRMPAARRSPHRGLLPLWINGRLHRGGSSAAAGENFGSASPKTMSVRIPSPSDSVRVVLGELRGLGPNDRYSVLPQLEDVRPNGIDGSVPDMPAPRRRVRRPGRL
jgi:hypothetical protein